MSSQSSTIKNIKDTATSTYESITNPTSTTQAQNATSNPDTDTDPSNFSKDIHGNTFQKGDYKDQLNQAATSSLQENKEQEPPADGLVGKALSYIPGVGTSNSEMKEEGKAVNPGQPPHRPEHDVQVEEFLRGQYHSKAGDGMPDPDKE